MLDRSGVKSGKRLSAVEFFVGRPFFGVNAYTLGVTRRRMFVSFITLLGALSALAQGPNYAWIEAEKPTTTNVKIEPKAWGHKEFLSGGAWIQIQSDANRLSEMPPDGAKLSYRFQVANAGRQEIWNRVGYEFVRSPFDWRVDQGAWNTVSNEALTTDLMALQDWNEVAWLRLGSADLTSGEHTLEIRVPVISGKNLLYASDCICIAPSFHPKGRFRPDESDRNARDEAAAKSVFKLGPTANSLRFSVPLKGDWEIARDDEQLPGEVAIPMPPSQIERRWKAIAVPSDKNEDATLTYAHRIWYRTRFQSAPGDHGYTITFPANNLNTTVYVNGIMCGFNKNPYAKFDIDISKAVRPGLNTIEVGIRDAWYGYSTNPNDPMKLRRRWNLPLRYGHEGFQDLAYPIWGAFQSGILATPILTATGSAYVADVFVKPSVTSKSLSVDLIIANPFETDRTAQLVCQVIDPDSGVVAWTLPERKVELRAGISKTVSATGSTPSPKLWWPDRPHLYALSTRLLVDGKEVDVQKTTFGFREWSARGTQFLLNGIPYRAWADIIGSSGPDDFLRQIKLRNQHMIRLAGAAQNSGIQWNGMPIEEALDFLDRNGLVVRRSGILDGEAIGYMAIENDKDLAKASPIKLQLLNNWRDQMVAQVRGERNHPSIMLWSIENEFLYINCINLYGGLMDEFEAEILKTADAVREVDPTRLVMTDGGGATKSNGLPVHGDHYVFDDFSQYPTRAYETHAKGGGRGRWQWDQKRPRLIGEDFFANGVNPADLATIGGEVAFAGKAQAKPAGGLVARMLNEGYRWQELGGWHLWMNTDNATEDYFKGFAERALFVREWDWTFNGGAMVKRTFGVFNDSHVADPITAHWELKVGGKSVAKGSKLCNVEPGTNLKFAVSLPMPNVTARTEAVLSLKLTVAGKVAFIDTKAVSILPSEPIRVAGLAVYDPSGGIFAYLAAQKVPFLRVKDLASLPNGVKVLVVGPNALTVEQSVLPTLTAIAARGVRVVVLEQAHPLHFRGLPADADSQINDGRVAFAENLEHPVMRGLAQKDFFTWGTDEVVYRDAYLKPRSGALSLVQCGNRLVNSALMEVPVGDSLLVVCQLSVGEKLTSNATARRLFANLLAYTSAYRRTVRNVSSFASSGGPFARAMAAIGLDYRPANSILDTISGAARIATIEATPKNLHELVTNLPRVRAFTSKGGWIVFNGLTPEGLADYNRIVGFDHMIRPFRRERVLFPPQRNPLTAGLNLGDVVMLSSERIFNFTSDVYVSRDEFSYIVDLEDVAPFAQLPSDYHYNTVNAFVSADSWKLIFSFDLDHGKPEYEMHFPKAQTFRQFDWTGNGFYHLVKKVELTFDKKDRAVFDTKPNTDPQSFAINPPRTAKDIALKVLEWTDNPTSANVVGIDNLSLVAARPASYFASIRPMLNIGGLVQYRQGSGGIVLCNLKFTETEDVAENVGKKRRILAAILRNLNAPFAGSKVLVPGAGILVQPIEIGKYATQFRDEKGWFGDNRYTFKDLPSGSQVFADVPFNVFEFPTSPVPNSLMLNGRGVPNQLPSSIKGIAVNRKASALFFLHTARIDKADDKHIFAAYVIHYADGTSVEIPLRVGENIDSYRQRDPKSLPRAGVAWTKPFGSSPERAVAYIFQWDNPKPQTTITSFDLVYRETGIAVPALLAVSASN